MEGFCFVQPLKSLKEDLLDIDHEIPLMGIVKYVDGSDFVNKEELVGFTPHSEYEFIVDSKRLYRIPLKSISIKYDRKGNEVEYNPSRL